MTLFGDGFGGGSGGGGGDVSIEGSVYDLDFQMSKTLQWLKEFWG